MHKGRQHYSELPTVAPDSDSTITVPQIDSQPTTPTRAKAKLPNRTTKNSQKLALFPEEQVSPIEDFGTTYNQISHLPPGTSRIEAEKFSKQERNKLPRVTAYCTASSYRVDDLLKCLQDLKSVNGTDPKRFDECIYTPFSFHGSAKPPATADLLGIASDSPMSNQELLPELFYFEYGVVVIWGMTEEDEKEVLRNLIAFEEEKLGAEDVVTEEFHYHYAVSYQPRIYNDVITLKNSGNYMIKLTISHAVAQSVKMTYFEELIEETIKATKHIPRTMAETGKVHMSRTAILKKIGQLFIMRININLVSNVLDIPEIFWSEPDYEELYKAIRGYLEISHRADILNQRVSVINDLLEMMKDHLTSSHGEELEWIIIILIVVEIIVGVFTIYLEALVYANQKKG